MTVTNQGKGAQKEARGRGFGSKNDHRRETKGGMSKAEESLSERKAAGQGG